MELLFISSRAKNGCCLSFALVLLIMELLLIIRPWSCCLSWELLLISSRAKNGCCLSFAVVLLIRELLVLRC